MRRKPPSQSLLADEQGATFVEYIVVLCFIAIFSVVAWKSYHNTIKNNAKNQYVTFGNPP